MFCSYSCAAKVTLYSKGKFIERPWSRTDRAEVVDKVARRSVEGILADDPTIKPHSQSKALVKAVGDAGERLADRVNPILRHWDGWDNAK